MRIRRGSGDETTVHFGAALNVQDTSLDVAAIGFALMQGRPPGTPRNIVPPTLVAALAADILERDPSSPARRIADSWIVASGGCKVYDWYELPGMGQVTHVAVSVGQMPRRVTCYRRMDVAGTWDLFAENGPTLRRVVPTVDGAMAALAAATKEADGRPGMNELVWWMYLHAFIAGVGDGSARINITP